jgi:hypothetical protein
MKRAIKEHHLGITDRYIKEPDNQPKNRTNHTKMDFNADGSAAVIKEGSKLREFLTERINQFDMQNHLLHWQGKLPQFMEYDCE